MHSTRALVTLSESPLNDLVRDLCTLGDLRHHAASVDARLVRFRLPLGPIIRRLHFPECGYLRTRIFQNSAFELLLLTWARQAVSPVHDHADQDCFFLPIAGEFHIQDYVIAQKSGRTARLVACGERHHGPGELDRRDAEQAIHAVRALSPRAISLHLYARPIERCRVFNLRHDTWRWRRVHCDAQAPLAPGD